MAVRRCEHHGAEDLGSVADPSGAASNPFSVSLSLFGCSKLVVAKTGLLFEQNARHPHIDRHEHTASQLEIVQYALMKGLQLPRPFTGELIPVLDFPASKFHQVLVDDVADMF